MDSNTPEFITCAMDAIEQGVKAADIVEECACRLWFSLAGNDTQPTHQ